MLLTWSLLVFFIRRYYQYGHKEERDLHCSASISVTGIWKMCIPCGWGGGEDEGVCPLARFCPHSNMPGVSGIVHPQWRDAGISEGRSGSQIG